MDIDKEGLTYKDAGVDIERADAIVEEMSEIVASTHTDGVTDDFGGFAASFLPPWQAYSRPGLVACTDGVGTKMKLARAMDNCRTVGIDCVAMVANDLVTSGARPLFFLDYIAANALDPDTVLDLVRGIADGCRQAGFALIGGETAEMPGTYAGDDYELVGFGVGIAETDADSLPRPPEAGDSLVALAASGVHSNGFSLVRRLIEHRNWDLDQVVPPLDCSIGEEFLKPTRIYVEPVMDMFDGGHVVAAAHVTGGGIIGNVPRILPRSLRAEIDWNSWQIPAVFELIAREGGISGEEMRRTFNLGVGMVVVTPPGAERNVIGTAATHAIEAWTLGHITGRE